MSKKERRIELIDQYDNFEGVIDGLSIHSLRHEFFDIVQFKDFKTRDTLIRNLLDKYNTFLTTYYSEYFDPDIGAGENGSVTSEHNNVSKIIEMLGTLLINADNEDNPYDRSYFDTSL